jgi:hypothetical protein
LPCFVVLSPRGRRNRPARPIERARRGTRSRERASKRWDSYPQLQKLNGRRAVAAAALGKVASLRLNLMDVKEFAQPRGRPRAIAFAGCVRGEHGLETVRGAARVRISFAVGVGAHASLAAAAGLATVRDTRRVLKKASGEAVGASEFGFDRQIPALAPNSLT